MAILCSGNLKVKVTKYRILFDRFEFSAHQLCKNKWIKRYSLKSQEIFDVLDFRFKGKIKVISSQRHQKKIINYKSRRNQKLCLYVRHTLEKWGFVIILVVILCLVNLKVKVTKYRILFDRFEFSTHQLCKNKWIKRYSLKSKEIFDVLDFSPEIDILS